MQGLFETISEMLKTIKNVTAKKIVTDKIKFGKNKYKITAKERVLVVIIGDLFKLVGFHIGQLIPEAVISIFKVYKAANIMRIKYICIHSISQIFSSIEREFLDSTYRSIIKLIKEIIDSKYELIKAEGLYCFQYIIKKNPSKITLSEYEGLSY